MRVPDGVVLLGSKAYCSVYEMSFPAWRFGQMVSIG